MELNTRGLGPSPALLKFKYRGSQSMFVHPTLIFNRIYH